MASPKALTGNRLLDALPEEERTAIESKARSEPIHPFDILIDVEETIGQVYFPLSGVISLVTPLTDGRAIETASIGYEGIVGIRAFLGGEDIGNSRVVAQLAGEMLVLDVEDFRTAASAESNLKKILKAYVQALFAQVSQNVACATSHDVRQRTARWLLEAHDRVREEPFRLTQEFLAEMLGVTRPSVSVAAGQLQGEGLIAYRKGTITVLNRTALEESACECFLAVKGQYERFLPA